MIIKLNKEQQQLLEEHGITTVAEGVYSEEEAFDLLEQVHDIEVRYAQEADANPTARKLANEYATIADVIQNQIPEE